jgi:hypothetical protein
MALFARGAENVIGVVVWPIFIYLLLNESFVAVGALSSLIMLVSVALQYITGRYLDRVQRRTSNVLHIGSVLSALGWIAKVFVATAYQVFIAGLYHNFAKIFMNTPFATMYYDLAADSGHYVDEVTMLREMALHLGKVVTLVLVIALSLFVPMQWTFLLAAAAALLLNALYAGHAEQCG